MEQCKKGIGQLNKQRKGTIKEKIKLEQKKIIGKLKQKMKKES